MHLKNQANEYQAELGKLFEEMPKAVLAAVAVSFATQGGNELDQAQVRVAKEWSALHLAGIVPQKPQGLARHLIASNPDE